MHIKGDFNVMDTPPPGHKIGKHMLVITWMIILIGLVAAFGTWEEAQYNPNQRLLGNASGEVILQRNRQNHYVASGVINGHSVVFLLDTGATDVVVPADLAQKLGLQPGYRQNAVTANGIVTVRETLIEELQLGGIYLSDVKASINPGMSGDEILLGMSALKDLEFTQSGNTLSLRQINGTP